MLEANQVVDDTSSTEKQSEENPLERLSHISDLNEALKIVHKWVVELKNDPGPTSAAERQRTILETLKSFKNWKVVFTTEMGSQYFVLPGTDVTFRVKPTELDFITVSVTIGYADSNLLQEIMLAKRYDGQKVQVGWEASNVKVDPVTYPGKTVLVLKGLHHEPRIGDMPIQVSHDGNQLSILNDANSTTATLDSGDAEDWPLLSWHVGHKITEITAQS